MRILTRNSVGIQLCYFKKPQISHAVVSILLNPNQRGERTKFCVLFIARRNSSRKREIKYTHLHFTLNTDPPKPPHCSYKNQIAILSLSAKLGQRLRLIDLLARLALTQNQPFETKTKSLDCAKQQNCWNFFFSEFKNSA